MGVKNPTTSITPFPTDIDRAYFGTWLSGFTDGEGCFGMYIVSDPRYPKTKIPTVRFQIKLRKDDVAVLQLVQSYLMCGAINYTQNHPPANPSAIFKVHALLDLKDIVVPHFERFPLLAKKKEDFWYWKRAIALIYSVSQRPHEFTKDETCGFAAGRHVSKWKEEDLDKFYEIQETLQEQRRYR